MISIPLRYKESSIKSKQNLEKKTKAEPVKIKTKVHRIL